MSFLSSFKRVTAAVSTGGLSLLAPKSTQETIGTAVGVGTVLAAAAPVVGAAISGMGTAGGATAAGSATPGAGGIGGLLSGLKSGASFLTAGTQLMGGGIGSLLQKVGLPSGVATPSAPPPNSGGAPVDSSGAPTTFGNLRKVPLSAPFSGQGASMPGWPGGAGQFQQVAMQGGDAGIGSGLMIPAGNVPDFPGGMAMPIPSSGGMMQTAGTAVMARQIGALAGRALSLTRLLGPVGAAAALGIGAADLAKLIFHALTHHKRRRHRGISARDMRIAKRTIGKVERAHMQLEHAYGRASHRYARPRSSGRGRGQVIEMIKQ